jgi:expansin (peptidoglycan-binding protein)
MPWFGPAAPFPRAVPSDMKSHLRLGSLATFLLAAVAATSGCGAGGDAPACVTAAECPAGQACSAGVCVTPGTAQAGAPGVGGGSGGSGGGATPTAGNSAGGSVANGGGGGQAAVAGSGGVVGQGGASAQGGAVGQGGVGGSGVSGGAAGGAGGSVAGSGGGGGSSGGSGGAAGGSAGAGGSSEPLTVVGQCKDEFWPGASNGSVTRYDFRQGTSLPACANVITHKGGGSDGDWDTVEGISTGDGGYFGAMNTTDFKQGATCGACVEASYNGKKVVLTIVDECPVSTNPLCQKGHIDLSRKAIRQLESNGSLENLKNVSWKYVKCPAAGNVKARLHPNQNANWQPVVIENGLFPLKSVTLNGKAATRTGNTQGGNAWIAEGQKTPYTVRATDVNDNTITFSHSDPALKDVGLQFMCK